MRRAALALGVLVFLASGCAQQPCSNTRCLMAKQTRAKKALRHVVLFAFKAGTTDEQARQIEDAFRALPGKIDVIMDFEWGRDVSVENLAQGYTHCFFVTFADEKGRETYLPHPEHKKFVDLIGPHLDKVLVIDYWAQE